MKSRIMYKMRLLAFICAFISISVAGRAYASTKTVTSGPTSQVIKSKVEKQINWVNRDGKWYGYDVNGMLCHGWMQDQGVYYYLDNEGVCLINRMTPDGYYVDGNGAWYQRTAVILDETFTAPLKFPAAMSSWSGEKQLKELQEGIDDLLETRRIRITDTSVEYLAGTSNEEVIFGIYKDKESGAYDLMLKTYLDKTSVRKDRLATYDYMVFRAMIYQITSTPELLEDAVYSSWEEGNRWNISRTSYTQVGDAMVKYVSGNGYGNYHIIPAVY